MKFSKEKAEILEQLINMPPFRERRWKNTGIARLAKMNHPSLKDVPKEVLIDIVGEILAHDRYWRWWLEDKPGRRPDLRGRDYSDEGGFKEKEQIEQEAQIDLEYEPGYGMKINI